AAHLCLCEDLPPGRHPREGRPSEHGLLARGTRAFPRRRARRVPGLRTPAAKASALRDEASPQTCDGRCPAARDRQATEEGVRNPGRGVVQRRPARSAPGRACTGSTPEAGALRGGRGSAPAERAHDGPPGPPETPVDTLRVPALASPVAADP